MLKYRSDTTSLNRSYELAKLAKESGVPEYLDAYGQACYKLSKLDEAEKALNAAVEKQPENAAFRYHLASVYLAKDNRAKTKKILKEISNNSKSQQFEQIEEVNRLLKTL